MCHLIIMSHAFIGQRIAPDALTSGSILLINILVLYVGFKIYEYLSKYHFLAFLFSYFILFFIFIVRMEKRGSTFSAFIDGLAATARNFKLLAYFWALVLSFTFFPAVFMADAVCYIFILKILFSLKPSQISPSIVLFLIAAFRLFFSYWCRFWYIIIQEDPRNIINVLKMKKSGAI